jgi:NAD(P)H-dependent flavin oxidoreductase YrpB (nitropropane dioxygenase family)
MKHDMREILGIEFPLFAFSHCRDVVAAVSRAGGFGVLGGTRFTPESLETELRWIEDHCDGRPFGIDIIFPENLVVREVETPAQIMARLPVEHQRFVEDLMARHGLIHSIEDGLAGMVQASQQEIGEQLLDVAFRHPIKLVANALGIAPPGMIARAQAAGIPCAALVGSKEHAVRQVEAGVDIVIAQGTEAGAHCGEVSTLVLVPEVVRAVAKVRDVPVLAAGGIVTGQQMAAAMALGAAGAWTGSVWLATSESEVSETFRQKMIAATSRDTVRSRARTGKPCRQLRSAWHDAWEQPDAPAPLGMPLQGLLAIPALNRAEAAADQGAATAEELVSYYVGQGVGLIENVRSATAVVQTFKEEFVEGLANVESLLT